VRDELRSKSPVTFLEAIDQAGHYRGDFIEAGLTLSDVCSSGVSNRLHCASSSNGTPSLHQAASDAEEVPSASVKRSLPSTMFAEIEGGPIGLKGDRCTTPMIRNQHLSQEAHSLYDVGEQAFDALLLKC
jgi:hypothetical protein